MMIVELGIGVTTDGTIGDVADHAVQIPETATAKEIETMGEIEIIIDGETAL